MKKSFIITSIIISSFVSVSMLNSCRDAIDIVQEGELTPEVVLTSVKNMESFLIGDVYASFDTNEQLYVSAVLSDEVKPGKGSGGQQFGLHRLFIDSKEEMNGRIWARAYKAINRANVLLDAASKITPTGDDVAKYNSIVAQARVIRAYNYLQLQAFYSVNMKDDAGLGVMIIEGVPTTLNNFPRKSNKEVFDFINADLDAARTVLKRGTDRYKVDLNVIDAISARMNLYRGKYAEAKIAALNILNNAGITLTQATPATNEANPTVGTASWWNAFSNGTTSFNPYRNMWNDSNRGEVIFSLNRLAGGAGTSIGSRWNTNQSNINGSPMWYMGRNLFNIIDSTDGDIRKWTFLDPSSTIDENYLSSPSPIETDALIIDKYPGIANSPLRNDLKLFRLSEMYFILAECEVVEKNYTKAAEYIQKVREARNYKGTATTPTYTNDQVALADILKERRVELAFEGHRLIDLKRLAVAAGVTMDRNVTDDAVEVKNLENGSYKYTLPIPEGEMNSNSSMVQNPGYGN